MPDGQPVEIPFLFLGAEDTPILFSNMQVVQHEEKEFIITFGQYAPPLAVGSEEEIRDKMQRTPHVPVRTVARIGMTPERFERFVGALQANLEKWKSKQG